MGAVPSPPTFGPLCDLKCASRLHEMHIFRNLSFRLGQKQILQILMVTSAPSGFLTATPSQRMSPWPSTARQNCRNINSTRRHTRKHGFACASRFYCDDAGGWCCLVAPGILTFNIKGNCTLTFKEIPLELIETQGKSTRYTENIVPNLI